MSAKHDITIKQGASFVLQGQLVTAVTSEPRDISGFNIRGQIRPTYSSSLNYAMTGSITTASAGRWEMSMTAPTTAAIPYGCYVYDIELYSDTTVDRIIEGRATVSPEVTR